MRMPDREKKDLIKAFVALSVAFTILNTGFSISQAFFIVFILSAFTVGTGFIFHELAHRYFARRFGCFAEFRSFDNMLILAIVMSFFGFIFAAPGAVFISGNVNARKNGIISAAGPASNFILAALFLLVFAFSTPSTILNTAGYYGYFINVLLGLFNMIPFGNFDGIKILAWDKAVYGAIIGAGMLIFIIGGAL